MSPPSLTPTSKRINPTDDRTLTPNPTPAPVPGLSLTTAGFPNTLSPRSQIRRKINKYHAADIPAHRKPIFTARQKITPAAAYVPAIVAPHRIAAAEAKSFRWRQIPDYRPRLQVKSQHFWQFCGFADAEESYWYILYVIC